MTEIEEVFLRVFDHERRLRDRKVECVLALPGLSGVDKDLIRKESEGWL